jgi:tetratricopeptide (TPR) repeat protein
MIGYLRHDYEGAVPHLADAFRGFSEIGDLLGIATCLQNLGNCRRELGDVRAARGDYARALGSYAVTGDRWLLATMVEDVAMLVADDAPAAACRLLGAAEAARETIGARRVDHEEAEIARHLRRARERLGAAATREQDAGRALDLGAARELALGLCRT